MEFNTSSDLVPKVNAEHPEFTTESLSVDVETATEKICDTLKGVTATETADGVKFRTTDGKLLALLTEDAEEGTVKLHYRTAPASEVATLKARKLWRAVELYAE